MFSPVLSSITSQFLSFSVFFSEVESPVHLRSSLFKCATVCNGCKLSFQLAQFGYWDPGSNIYRTSYNGAYTFAPKSSKFSFPPVLFCFSSTSLPIIFSLSLSFFNLLGAYNNASDRSHISIDWDF